jgi:hypothetical protein
MLETVLISARAHNPILIVHVVEFAATPENFPQHPQQGCHPQVRRLAYSLRVFPHGRANRRQESGANYLNPRTVAKAQDFDGTVIQWLDSVALIGYGRQ